MYFSSMLSPIVKVSVGDAKATFHLHSDLLCKKTSYFRGCLQGQFSESVTREVVMLETNPNAFQYFVKWLYTGDLAPFTESTTYDKDFHRMIDVYALGDELVCDGLKNRAVDMVQEICERQHLDAEQMLYAAQSIRQDSKLMQYLVEQLACDMTSIGYQKFIEDKEWTEFITMDGRTSTGLLCKLKEWQTGETKTEDNDPSRKEDCRWHEHPGSQDLDCERWSTAAFFPD